MKSYFYILVSFLLLASCAKEQEMDNGTDKIPEQVFGNWLYTINESDEYYFCQGLSFTSTTGYWQITQQEYNDKVMCGGTMRYDENSQTLYLNCSQGEHEHVKLNGNEIKIIKIISSSNEKLVVSISGDTIEYSRNNESYIIPHYEWTNGYDDDLNPAGSIPASGDNGVDLGLSVFWSKYNMGSDDNRAGGCYGWGDAIGTCYSEYEVRYPNSNPPTDISGSEYDIATNKWGNGWRIPTKEEVQELIDNCFITWSTWRQSWEFTSKINGNKMILPAAQVRYGKSTYYSGCGYWTSTLDAASGDAYALYIPKIGDDIINSISYLKRSYGLQIRPVKDKD